jgi:branched-chain amino acid transport system ATP-binding protein
MTDALLRTERLACRFGGLVAVGGVDVAVQRGNVQGLIGPNGAGKTTFLNLISGHVRPTGGAIFFDNSNLEALPPQRRAAIGIRRTFQNLRLFREMTALENVMVGLHSDTTSEIFHSLLRGGKQRREEDEIVQRARAALEFVGLAGCDKLVAGALPYGHQRLLEIARAFVAAPKLLLLDEPAAGLNGAEAGQLVGLIRRIQATGVTVILVEHHMEVVMQACDRIVVLNYGKKLADGSPADIRDHSGVIEAYLGTRRHSSARHADAGPIPAQVNVEQIQAPADRKNALLRLSGLHVKYGQIPALRGLDLDVNAGEIVALIGTNGAGKSTTLKAISGLVSPSAGNIELNGQSLAGLAPEQRVELGIVQVPEGRRIFPRLSVGDNLLIGAYPGRARADERQARERVYSLFPRLAERRRQAGGSLSGGEQQMLAFGRAMMAQPLLLLLDEPSLGLAPILVEEVAAAIGRFHRDGATILLVEQNAELALSLASRGFVIETGRIVLTGSGPNLLENPKVWASYLGQGGWEAAPGNGRREPASLN